MYLDTSNVQSLKEKLLLCAVNEFAEYGYEGARSIILLRLRGVVNRRFIITLVIKKIYLLKYWNIHRNDIRQKKKALDFSDLPPQKAIEKIIDFTWDYYIANPGF